jgi:phage N-6-adenine-methyltransferase
VSGSVDIVRVEHGGLAKYDAQKGVKKIAVLEMAEKHYARAKDASKLLEAIRAKLEAQAEFVLWWDTQVEKNRGGRPSTKPRTDLSEVLTLGENGLPAQKTVSRWRQKLNDPDAFERTLATVCAKYPQLLEFEGAAAHVANNSGNNEWYTPDEYIEAARRVLGEIDLDPASSAEANAVVKARQFYSEETNGLEQPWHGKVWMNPPYAQPLISWFCERLAQHLESGDVTESIVLVNNATETSWFVTLASVADALCFPKGRVRFWAPGKDSAAPLQGQALLYSGPRVDDFCREFMAFGTVAIVVRPHV